MFDFSEFFEQSFNEVTHFMMSDLPVHLPTPCAECSSDLTKTSVTPMSHPLYSPSLAPGNFFFVSPMKKVLKGKCFAHVEEVKQKMAEALKAIKIDKFKNCFE